MQNTPSNIKLLPNLPKLFECNYDRKICLVWMDDQLNDCCMDDRCMDDVVWMLYVVWMMLYGCCMDVVWMYNVVWMINLVITLIRYCQNIHTAFKKQGRRN